MSRPAADIWPIVLLLFVVTIALGAPARALTFHQADVQQGGFAHGTRDGLKSRQEEDEVDGDLFPHGRDNHRSGGIGIVHAQFEIPAEHLEELRRQRDHS